MAENSTSADPDDILASALAELDDHVDDERPPPPQEEAVTAVPDKDEPKSSSGMTPGFLNSSGDAKKARMAKQKAARAAREAKTAAAEAGTGPTGPARVKEEQGKASGTQEAPGGLVMATAKEAEEATATKYAEQATAAEIAALNAKVTDRIWQRARPTDSVP